MAIIITKEDLKTKFYPEIMDEITRGDDDILDKAISAAVTEAKGYLSKYELDPLFGTDENEASVTDAQLKDMTLDLAAWKLIKLSNPNIDLKLFRTSYEDAKEWFGKVQSGKIDPDGWPYKAADPDTNFDPGSAFLITSNPKRTNHW